MTLTVNGPFEAGLYQVFDCVGTGSVVFGSGSVSEVYPQWFGMAETSTDTVNVSAINKSADSISSNYGTVRIGPTGSSYGINDQIDLTKCNVIMDAELIVANSYTGDAAIL